MNRLQTTILGLGTLAVANAGAALAGDDLPALRSALADGKPNLDLRLRYESVDQDNALEGAAAGTVRTRLGYTTDRWNGLDAGIEFEGVEAIGAERYNSTLNGRTGFATVADPKGNELNQAFVRYAGLPGTVVKYGRQRIVLDNARFVGNVGWRQNEQTFDAARLTGNWIPKTTIDYAFVTDINTVTFADLRLHGHLLNVIYAPAQWLSLTAYGYLLDWSANATSVPNAPGSLNPPQREDSRTFGLRATGSIALGAGKLVYAADVARQSDYSDSAIGESSYLLAELGYGIPAIGLKLGYEVLGGDGTDSFQTPLATLHAFQGWADQFLMTPRDGIKDSYAQISGTLFEKLGWLLRGHQFAADEGGRDYGDEIDVQLTWAFLETLSVGAKYADYNARSVSVDTTKSWAWIEYRF
ncbi:hypothetical protein E4T66_19990 [Sinimarinibacterium sp. CAU 1509]|uniref:alginate export family protein n=1 Tax=Sinimarinibacterium sp. CAU 1509 TaxID=2562283 RepID=UPI0010AC775E|nr:alginate export family protein [Sinimarinibacterium sp. CAU 1509]TJY56243.1 hypothetical protein E4T66_19990 [Sinimarinibacterium sp. CAU 1509]